MKTIIALDFDGVIHSYKSGWQGARNIPDPPVEGAIEWINDFLFVHCTLPDNVCAMMEEGDCELAIFSSRSRYFGGRRAVKKWLVKHGLDARLLEAIRFPLFKPASHVLLDDRAVTFTGQFPDPQELIGFVPWHKKRKPIEHEQLDGGCL